MDDDFIKSVLDRGPDFYKVNTYGVTEIKSALEAIRKENIDINKFPKLVAIVNYLTEGLEERMDPDDPDSIRGTFAMGLLLGIVVAEKRNDL